MVTMSDDSRRLINRDLENAVFLIGLAQKRSDVDIYDLRYRARLARNAAEELLSVAKMLDDLIASIDTAPKP